MSGNLSLPEEADHLTDNFFTEIGVENIDYIGGGFFGQAFRGNLIGEDEKKVVIKVSRPWKILDARGDIENDMDFLKEINVFSKVGRDGHPNIIQLYDFGRVGSLNYMVMESADEDFAEISYEIDGSDDELIMFDLCQILRGMYHIQRLGFVHSDIKNENILVEKKTGRLMIGDFGLTEGSMCSLKNDIIYFMGFTSGFVPISVIKSENNELQTENAKTVDVWSLGLTMCENILKNIPKAMKKFNNLIKDISFSKTYKETYKNYVGIRRMVIRKMKTQTQIDPEIISLLDLMLAMSDIDRPSVVGLYSDEKYRKEFPFFDEMMKSVENKFPFSDLTENCQITLLKGISEYNHDIGPNFSVSNIEKLYYKNILSKKDIEKDEDGLQISINFLFYEINLLISQNIELFLPSKNENYIGEKVEMMMAILFYTLSSKPYQIYIDLNFTILLKFCFDILDVDYGKTSGLRHFGKKINKKRIFEKVFSIIHSSPRLENTNITALNSLVFWSIDLLDIYNVLITADSKLYGWKNRDKILCSIVVGLSKKGKDEVYPFIYTNNLRDLVREFVEELYSGTPANFREKKFKINDPKKQKFIFLLEPHSIRRFTISDSGKSKIICLSNENVRGEENKLYIQNKIQKTKFGDEYINGKCFSYHDDEFLNILKQYRSKQ